MKSVTHEALDGGRIELRTNLETGEPYTSFLNLQLGSHIQEFSSGMREYAAANGRDLGVERFEEEYHLTGGTLRLGSTIQDIAPHNKVRATLAVAAWEGTSFSLFTHAYNADSAGELLGILAQVRISESAFGVTLAPQDPVQTPITHVSVVKDLPGLGLLQIEPATPELIKSLPGWPGSTVAGGELFIDNTDGGGSTFVLAGRSAITRIIPDPDDAVDKLLPALAELRIDWVRS